MTITVLGTPLSWNAKYSADASFTPVQKTLTAGVALRHLTPSGSGNTKFRTSYGNEAASGCLGVKKASYTPYVVWSESCPVQQGSWGKLTKTECTEAGGNRTLVKDGQSYSMLPELLGIPGHVCHTVSRQGNLSDLHRQSGLYPRCHTSAPFTPKKVPVCMNMPRTPVSQKHPGK